MVSRFCGSTTLTTTTLSSAVGGVLLATTRSKATLASSSSSSRGGGGGGRRRRHHHHRHRTKSIVVKTMSTQNQQKVEEEEEDGTTYDRLKEKLAEIDCLSSLAGLAGWDELTMMPSGEHAAKLRSKASAVLAGVIHQKSIDEELGALIATARPTEAKDVANVKRAKEEYERSAKIPADMAKDVANVKRAKEEYERS